jgi:uncharacterized protein
LEGFFAAKVLPKAIHSLFATVDELAKLMELRRYRPYMKAKRGLSMDQPTQTELEAAVYRRLVEHLRKRTDVQNIDLMNLAGFCRNCLSNWMQDAARERGQDLGRDAAREAVYGMPYDTWKALHQSEATGAQQSAFASRTDKH